MSTSATVLPEGWEMKKLGEVCEIKPSKKEAKDKLKGHDLVSFLPMEDLGELEKYVYSSKQKSLNAVIGKYTYFANNDVLLAKITPCFENGKLGIARGMTNGIGFGSSEYVVLRPQSEITAEYVFYILTQDTFREEGKKNMTGAVGHKRVSKDFIANFKLPLPPLPEQQRLVALLDRCFAAIDRAKVLAEQNLQNARALFESYLQGVFQNKGDGWEEKTIGDIGNPKMCKRIFKEQTTAKGDIPFYKIGTFGKEPDAFISKAIYDEFREKYSFPKKGEVLISAAGTIGRRVRYNGEPAYFQDSNIVWIENDEKQVSNDFLYEFYGACDWGSTKGATILRLYNDNLKSIKISFPKSKEEQQTIVRQLDVLRAETQKLEAAYLKKIADLEELKKSVLEKAFRGELVEV